MLNARYEVTKLDTERKKERGEVGYPNMVTYLSGDYVLINSVIDIKLFFYL